MRSTATRRRSRWGMRTLAVVVVALAAVFGLLLVAAYQVIPAHIEAQSRSDAAR